MEDYIKCELIGGGSPRHFNTFLTCLLLLYTTHINTCYVLLLLLTVHMYTMLSSKQIIRTYHILLTAPCRVSKSILQRNCNTAQETVDILVEDQLRSSFGHGNS